jgi:hypothetical protein
VKRRIGGQITEIEFHGVVFDMIRYSRHRGGSDSGAPQELQIGDISAKVYIAADFD